MKNLLCPLLLLASLASFAACRGPASQGVPLPAQDVLVTSPDLARIYCVREEEVGSTGLRTAAIEVHDGDRVIGELNSGTFLCWERKGGRTLGRGFYQAFDPSLGRLDGIADFDCPAGGAYYYNVTVRRSDGKPVFQLLKAEEGRALVAKRKWAGQ
jgi:hypothetical protein